MSARIEGYAARYNDITTIGGEFRERLARGCFDRTLRSNDVVMLLDHDPGRVLGRKSAGTLKLTSDAIGLKFELDVDETTPEGQTALGTVRRQDVAGCSFGFFVRAETWEDGDLKLPLRTITDVDLFECTLTAFPAYPSTEASVARKKPAGSADNARNARSRIASKRRAEAAMRARGLL